MAKRIDIGRGFAAVMNHPEPGPTVFRMARGILRAEGKPLPYLFPVGGVLAIQHAQQGRPGQIG